MLLATTAYTNSDISGKPISLILPHITSKGVRCKAMSDSSSLTRLNRAERPINNAQISTKLFPLRLIAIRVRAPVTGGAEIIENLGRASIPNRPVHQALGTAGLAKAFFGYGQTDLGFFSCGQA